MTTQTAILNAAPIDTEASHTIVPTVKPSLRLWAISALQTITSFPVVIASALVAAVFWICRNRIGDPDLWWHLRDAQYFVTNLRLPQIDTYSHTTPGLYWMNHEWLSELFYYRAYRACDLRGVYLLFLAPSSPRYPARWGPATRQLSPVPAATARSGGALNSAYGSLLQGGKVYTIYIDTSVGTAVLQFAERLASTQEFQADLVAPEPTNLDLPKDLPPPHVLMSCILDKSGMIKNPRLLRSGDDRTDAYLMAAIQKWQFRPALRGNEPVEVDAILGFSVDNR
jgi:hypothetical protein